MQGDWIKKGDVVFRESSCCESARTRFRKRPTRDDDAESPVSLIRVSQREDISEPRPTGRGRGGGETKREGLPTLRSKTNAVGTSLWKERFISRRES